MGLEVAGILIFVGRLGGFYTPWGGAVKGRSGGVTRPSRNSIELRILNVVFPNLEDNVTIRDNLAE